MFSETLYETDDFPKPARDVAALVASKVYYFLGEYDEALSFALGSGNAFHIEARTPGSEEYVETITCMFFSLSLWVTALVLTPHLQLRRSTAISKHAWQNKLTRSR
jgi:hypothetical protein